MATRGWRKLLVVVGWFGGVIVVCFVGCSCVGVPNPVGVKIVHVSYLLCFLLALSERGRLGAI